MANVKEKLKHELKRPKIKKEVNEILRESSCDKEAEKRNIA